MPGLGFLYPILSLLWCSVNFVRRFFYARGFKKSVRLDARQVVSVGNIEAGGTGKTPVTALIAREAVVQKLSVAILTRGYRGAAEGTGAILRPGEKPDPSVVGDEPALLSLLVPDAWIGVGADRVESYERLKAEHGKAFDLVLLDDGFQHLRILRDVDLVLETSRNLFQVLKREFAASVPSSAVKIVTKAKAKEESEVRSSMPGQIVFDLEFSQRPHAKESLWVVAGVADPRSVGYTLEALGHVVAKLIAGRDHATYTRPEIQAWLTQAAGANARLVLTGKDYVKWVALEPAIAQNPKVIWIEPRARVVAGQDTWFAKLWRRSP